MTIVEDRPVITGGVDTHADMHVAAALDSLGGLLGVGEFVLAEWVVRGTLKGPLGRLAPSDRAFAVHRAAIFQIGRGALTSISIFMNEKELAEAVGQWPGLQGK